MDHESQDQQISCYLEPEIQKEPIRFGFTRVLDGGQITQIRDRQNPGDCQECGRIHRQPELLELSGVSGKNTGTHILLVEENLFSIGANNSQFWVSIFFRA